MNKKPYKEGSIVDLAAEGFSKIKTLAKSSSISDKLSAINMLLWVLILGIIISFFLGGYLENMFVFIIIFAVSLLLSCISLLLYAPFLETILGIIENKNKVAGLRISINILVIDLTIALAGLLFKNDFLIKIAGGILALQIILLLLGSYAVIPSERTRDNNVNSSQLWKTLGKVSIIITLISFTINIVLILINL